MHKIRHQQPTGQNHQKQMSLRLRAPFGSSYLVEPDDIIDTKRALMALDYYRPVAGTEPGAFVDNDLFAGIKAFQRDHGLKVDGLMRPGGETETTLNAALRHADPSQPIPDGEGANDNQPPANENESGWDDARRPGGGWGGGGGGKGGGKGGGREERRKQMCDQYRESDERYCDHVFRKRGPEDGNRCRTIMWRRYQSCLRNLPREPMPRFPDLPTFED